MIIFLHNRYRTTGGEERAVEDLLWLVRERLREPAQLISRDSAEISRPGAAAALMRGGACPEQVAALVRRAGARIVHAHNLTPSFGWRALAAARAAGAKTVLHLHQYRLVCATGVCFRDGKECTRCHGRNTMPGVLGRCRGSLAEALAYGVALSLWQRRLLEHADAVIVPSEFARRRLQQLGAPLRWERAYVLPPPLPCLEEAPLPSAGPATGRYALLVCRLAAEKGVEVAIEACVRVRRPLVIVGDGPLERDLRRYAADIGAGEREVAFAGRLPPEQLAQLRAQAAIALVPSRSGETFGIAAAEAMAAGLPVVGSEVGALPELLPAESLVPPGDADALAQAIERLWGNGAAGAQALRRVAERCAPAVVAQRLRAVYAEVAAA